MATSGVQGGGFNPQPPGFDPHTAVFAIATTIAALQLSVDQLRAQMGDRFDTITETFTTLTRSMTDIQTAAKRLRVDIIPYNTQQVKDVARGLHNLGKVVKDHLVTGKGIAPTTLKENVAHLAYSVGETAFKIMASPAIAFSKLFESGPGLAKYTAVALGTYTLLPGLLDPYVPSIGHTLRAARSAAVNAGWWSTKQGVRAVVEEGIHVGKGVASDIKSQTQEYISKLGNEFIAAIPMMAPRETPSVPHTTAQRAAQGLGAEATPQAGSYAFQATTPPGPGSDLLPLLTLAVGVGALYIASSKLTAFWNSQAENKEESK